MIKLFQGIPQSVLFIGLILFLASCKSSAVLGDRGLDDKLSSRAIVKHHYQNQSDFKTLSGRVKIDYSDGGASKGVSVNFRMEKDKAIWLSAPLGVVKAYITPDRVTFYNKLQSEYFDGDFTYLNEVLGADLQFTNLQNMLLGEALFDLRKEKYTSSVAGGTYQLRPKEVMPLFNMLFQIEPKNFKMATQQIAQPLKKRLLQIDYTNYQKIDQWVLPETIAITAVENDHKNTIDLEYRNMEFNRSLTFPYKIPKGFKAITVNKNDL